MAEMLLIFAIVVNRLNAEDAIMWVMIGFDQILNLLLIVVAYFFGKNRGVTSTEEPPNNPAPSNVRAFPKKGHAPIGRSHNGKNAKSRSRRRRR
jgi:hypothetical protein